MKQILRAIQLQTQIQMDMHDIDTLITALEKVENQTEILKVIDKQIDRLKEKINKNNKELMSLDVTKSL